MTHKYTWRQLSEGILEAAAIATDNSVHAIRTNNPAAESARMIAIWLYVTNGFHAGFICQVINRQPYEVENLYRAACAALQNNRTWSRRLRNAQSRLYQILPEVKKRLSIK